uniref:Reverse transcriptase Ty1/copia-type domain-containing protein n=1 Tax=Fagus sylvatica TaxID=28930 RepID=A0A2N9GYN8_FAGSY
MATCSVIAPFAQHQPAVDLSTGAQNYSSNRPVCQVCQKPGHVALQCYHRFDNSYTIEAPLLCKLFLPLLNRLLIKIGTLQGATHHVTHDCQFKSPAGQGSDHIRVGSGSMQGPSKHGLYPFPPYSCPYQQLAFRLGYSIRHKGTNVFISLLVVSIQDVVFQESLFPFKIPNSPLPPHESVITSPPTQLSILGPHPFYSHCTPLGFQQDASIQHYTNLPGTRSPSLNQNPIPPIQPGPSPSSNTENLIPSSPNSPAPASPEPPPPFALPPASTIPPHLPSTHPMLTRSKHNILKPKTPTDDTIRYPLPKALLATASHLSHSTEPTCLKNASKDPQWRKAMNNEFDALLQNQTWTLVHPHQNQNIVGCKWVFRIKRLVDGSIERYKARLVAKGFHQQPRINYGETYSPVIKRTTVRTVLSLAISAVYVLIYVDDIIITSSSDKAIDTLLSNLKSDFAVKQLGPLKFFLAIEVIPTTSRVLLSQQRYITNILSCTKMLEAKPVSTPMASSTNLSAYEGEPFPDQTLFRSNVGALQ